MTDRKDIDDAALAQFFAAGRAATPQPSADLMARVLADAEAAMPVAAPRASRRPWWLAVFDGFGFAGAGGLAVATAAGFFVGINPGGVLPDLITPVYEVFSGQALEDYDDMSGLVGFGWDLDEG